MKKRIISALLCGVMAFSQGLIALAAPGAGPVGFPDKMVDDPRTERRVTVHFPGSTEGYPITVTDEELENDPELKRLVEGYYDGMDIFGTSAERVLDGASSADSFQEELTLEQLLGDSVEGAGDGFLAVGEGSGDDIVEGDNPDLLEELAIEEELYGDEIVLYEITPDEEAAEEHAALAAIEEQEALIEDEYYQEEAVRELDGEALTDADTFVDDEFDLDAPEGEGIEALLGNDSSISEGEAGPEAIEMLGADMDDEMEEEAYDAAKKLPSKISIAKTTWVYTGKNINPTVTVKDGSKTVDKKYYKVQYGKTSGTVGPHKLRVTFSGNYSGSKDISYSVVPKSTTLSKVTASKSNVTITVKKATGDFGGYGVQISKDKNFKTGVTTKTMSKSKTSGTIKNVPNGTWYIRVAPYKKVSGKNYIAEWSAAKSVKVSGGSTPTPTPTPSNPNNISFMNFNGFKGLKDTYTNLSMVKNLKENERLEIHHTQGNIYVYELETRGSDGSTTYELYDKSGKKTYPVKLGSSESMYSKDFTEGSAYYSYYVIMGENNVKSYDKSGKVTGQVNFVEGTDPYDQFELNYNNEFGLKSGVVYPTKVTYDGNGTGYSNRVRVDYYNEKKALAYYELFKKDGYNEITETYDSKKTLSRKEIVYKDKDGKTYGRKFYIGTKFNYGYWDPESKKLGGITYDDLTLWMNKDYSKTTDFDYATGTRIVKKEGNLEYSVISNGLNKSGKPNGYNYELDERISDYDSQDAGIYDLYKHRFWDNQKKVIRERENFKARVKVGNGTAKVYSYGYKRFS